jgi:Sugar (and other) transporter
VGAGTGGFISEDARSSAMSASTVVNWGADFLVAGTFLTLSAAISRQGTFYLYAVIALARKAPETKGRSLEDIQHDLTGGRPWRTVRSRAWPRRCTRFPPTRPRATGR